MLLLDMRPCATTDSVYHDKLLTIIRIVTQTMSYWKMDGMSLMCGFEYMMILTQNPVQRGLIKDNRNLCW